MTDYIPPALDWVREQVELYESSGGTEGTTLLVDFVVITSEIWQNISSPYC